LVFGTDKYANGKTNELFFTVGPTFSPPAEEYSGRLFGVITANDNDDQHKPDHFLQPR